VRNPELRSEETANKSKAIAITAKNTSIIAFYNKSICFGF